MNSLTQTQITQLKALLQQLLEWAQQLDRKKKPGKPQHWFDSSLFSCHSPDLADYVLDSLRYLIIYNAKAISYQPLPDSA